MNGYGIIRPKGHEPPLAETKLRRPVKISLHYSNTSRTPTKLLLGKLHSPPVTDVAKLAIFIGQKNGPAN